jgi:putative copper resistance protein D
MPWDVFRGLARGLSMAGFYTVFGTAYLSATLLRGRRVALGWLVAAGLLLALTASAAWYLLQTQDFAGAANWPDELAALPIVATDTRFGMLLLGRCAALAVAAALWGLGARRLAAGLAFACAVAESWLGHGGAMGGTTGDVLLVTSVAHVGAGAVWLGALPALAVALRALPDTEALRLARDFSPIGIGCVALLLLTAAVQYVMLIWRPDTLLTSDYGRSALVKLVLFAGLIAIAVANRLLTRAFPFGRDRLLANIWVEVGAGLCLLLAAGMIVQFAPPAMQHG